MYNDDLAVLSGCSATDKDILAASCLEQLQADYLYSFRTMGCNSYTLYGIYITWAEDLKISLYQLNQLSCHHSSRSSVIFMFSHLLLSTYNSFLGSTNMLVCILCEPLRAQVIH